MYTLSIMILSYLYFKNIFTTKISSSVLLLFFCFRQDRPTGTCTGHARLCMSVGRPPGSTDCLQVCSRVFWVDRPVDRLQKPVFLFRGRSTRAVDPSPTATASRADGRPDRSTARPAKCQRLFPLLCISEICFCNLFWQTFSELLEIFFRSNKLKINCF